MALINYAEKTNTRRFASHINRAGKSLSPQRKLRGLLKKHAGRSGGKVTVRHQGGRAKRQYREVDFGRNNFGVEGVVVGLEYDPNRNVDLALIKFTNGDYRYILAPKGMKKGDKVISDLRSGIKVGNAMQLKSMPIGTLVHNVELMPGRGGQLGRSAGTSIMIVAKEGGLVHLKLPSTEVRAVPELSLATVGVLGNEDWKNIKFGKAGRKRHMGIRPTVRGVAQDPESHAHGGGEARSGVGRKKPMTKYGRPAVGNTRKKKKFSNRFIIKRRKS